MKLITSGFRLLLVYLVMTMKIHGQCTVTVSASTSIACSGENFTLSTTTSGCGTGLQYLWSTGDVTSSIVTSVVNQGFTQINVTYTVSVTGSTGSTTATRTVVIRPEPQFHVSNLRPSICSQDCTMILMGSNVNGIQYNYTAQQTDVTGASNGNGVIINQQLTLTGIGSGSVQYTITPRVSNCYGQPKNALVQVI